MPIQELKDQISRLPEQPGVYLYFNAEGDTIYVGKARTLRDRVRNYLGAWGTGPKTDALLTEVTRLEVIVTDSVVEALALENNLIKERLPKYNILLRDDKTYPYLQLTTNEAFPRVLVARQVERDGSYYAGPFMPASLARRTMGLTHRLFGIRSCNEVITGKRERPCLEYDIKRCVAPCVDTVCSEQDYARAVEHTQLFLEGRNDDLLKTLRQRMVEAAEAERFEEAAQLRDAVKTVQTLQDRQQKMSTTELGHRDVFGMKVGPAGAAVQVFQVRNGRVVERVVLNTESAAAGESEAEILEAALLQFYEVRTPPPDVMLPVELPEPEAIESLLSERAGRKVRVSVPQRGDRKSLLALANRNAALAYESRFNEGEMAQFDALVTLQSVLKLPGLPRRIECFDISHIQGSETVASMVVCVDGRMKRSDYRKFRIRGTARSAHAGSDDFASMQEVVERRYRRVQEQGGPYPDLLLIDGGKGQLAAAYEALESLGLATLMAVGIAKKEELIFTREHVDPIALGRTDPALLLIQRIRDEAHRFAVTFHRLSRTKRDLRSELDEVPGVGPRRRRTLLKSFGSVAGVRRATREELAAVVGAKAADQVLAFFSGQT